MTSVHLIPLFYVVSCEFPVGVSSNVHQIPISGQQQTLYNEGDVIIYQCRTGFQPQDVNISVCGSDRLWSPDPARHNCIGKSVFFPSFSSYVCNSMQLTVVSPSFPPVVMVLLVQ